MPPRSKWSRADNICLMFCYHRSRPNESGYWKRFERLWEDSGHQFKAGSALASQVRSIQKSSIMLSDLELTEIRTIVASELSAPSPPTVLPLSLPTAPHNTFADLTSGASSAGTSALTSTPPTQSSPPNSSASPPQSATTTTSQPASQRLTWSRQMNTLLVQLHWCSEPNARGVWNRVAIKWNSSDQPSRTPSQLKTQFRSITQSGLLSPQALAEIRAASEQEGNSGDTQTDPDTPPDPTPPTPPQPHTRTHSTRPTRGGPTSLAGPQRQDVERRLLELTSDPSGIRLPDLRHLRWKDIRDQIDTISPVILTIPTPTLTSLNTLLLAVAQVISERLGVKPPPAASSDSSGPKKSKEPLWKRRMDKSVLQLRADLSRLTELSMNRRLKDSTMAEINRRYPLLSRKGIKTVIEEVKQRLQAKSAKIKRFEKKRQTFRQNQLFETHQRNFYRSLTPSTSPASSSVPLPEPDPPKFVEFWGGIWGDGTEHNSEAEWLPEVESDLSTVVPQPAFTITPETVAARVKGMSNWTSPGIDGLHGFWLKHVTCLHGRLASLFKECLDTGTIPAWMTEGHTYLILKDPSKSSTDPSNYRPITCLPNIWKLLTGILADKIYEHLDSNNLYPEEQKGCKRNSRGCKEQLLIDKLILRQCKRLRKSLHMSYIDYKKAYDSVPHSWIIASMSLCKLHPSIVSFFASSFTQCTVNLHLSGKNLGKVPIHRGLFQGDSVSPIHFIIALIPLSHLLNRSDNGFSIVSPDSSETVINHRLYMDDLKLYGRTSDELQNLLTITAQFSSDIRMEFGLSKCGTIHVTNGSRADLHGISLPDGSVLPDVEEGGYKYLGVLETDVILHKKMKELTSNEYFRRIKLLLKSALTSKNLIQAMNTWAIPVIRYGAGILNWTLTETRGLDIRTRKLLRLAGAITNSSDIDRLYISRKKGGRGLQRIEDVIVREETGLTKFFSDSTDPFLTSLFDAMQSEGMLTGEPIDREVIKVQHEQRLMEKWQRKPVHGRFLQQLDEGGCSLDDTWSWLCSQSMPKHTEAVIFAAQDQALRTNWLRSVIERTAGLSPLCRVCREYNESVEHILNGCQKLANSEYKLRHDRVAAAIHWGICMDLGFTTSSPWFLHYAEKVLENSQYKILWDFLVQCDRTITACKPDLILVNKQAKEAIIVDVAVPKDRLVADREAEKIQKYQELRRELARIWNLRKVTVVPIVIGALGGVTEKLPDHLAKLTKRLNVAQLQKSVLFSSTNILRTVLDM